MGFSGQFLLLRILGHSQQLPMKTPLDTLGTRGLEIEPTFCGKNLVGP